MLKNYFKIALRNLSKQKVLAFINIFGLSVGIACFSLFMLYALNEFSFDRFNTNAANIYRVYLSFDEMNGNPPGASAYHPMPLGPAMKQDLPGVENYIRFREGWGESFIKAGDAVTREDVSFADPAFLNVFSFKLRYGNAATALNDLHSVILSQSTATKIFGQKNPVGKRIEIKLEDDYEPFTVTGVAENPPSNSSITFKILGNFNYLASTQSGKRSVDNWHRSAYQTYVQLKPGSTLPSNDKLLASFRKKYYPDELDQLKKDGYKGTTLPVHIRLQPLREVHTDPSIGSGMVSSVDPKTIWIVLSIAAGVLLIACINFTTLSIGRSAGRSKEVGVRKVIGGTRKALVTQFLIEALVLSILSAMLGLLLAFILLPSFNDLSGRQLKFSFTQFPELYFLLAGLVLIVGLLSGSYPAVVLSNFKPVEVLKTKVKLGGANIFTRSLVTVQFVLSAGLIISTIIIMQQLHYMQSRYPGFNKGNIVVVDASGTDSKKIYPLFKQQLASQPAISGTTSTELSFGEGMGWSRSGFEYNGNHKDVFEYFIDNDYLDVMGMQLLSGRNFDAHISADTVTSVIINEAMMSDFGWTLKNAVGQRLTGYSEDATHTPVVIGVVKNFNFLSFAEKVEPQMFHEFSSYAPYKFLVRIKPGDPSHALDAVQSAWKNIAPGYPLKYSFLDEDLNRFYKSEARWSNIVGWAGGISVFLACLGLLGLAALAVVNRTKEIGIRKVLGASVSTIIRLLSKDFLKLVCIAFLIATPLAWWFMHKWLQDYPYRINIEWWVFGITGSVTILIALLTVSVQAVRAAIQNPVKSLRTE